MIGTGEYKQMTTDIEGVGIPRVGQRLFADALYRRTRCRIAWHKRRNVFCVYRIIGNRPVFYPTDLGRKHFPMTLSLLSLIADSIRLADAFRKKDGKKALEVYLRRQKEMAADDRRAFIDETFPDFYNKMTFLMMAARDGRARQKYFDTAQH